MAKNDSSVSLSRLDNWIGQHTDRAATLRLDTQDGFLDVQVEPYVSLEQMALIVGSVVDNVFDEEGAYHPELREAAEALQILRCFTNIRISTDAENSVTGAMQARLTALLYGTDLYARIRERISPRQINAIDGAIDRGIAYRCNLEAARLDQAAGLFAQLLSAAGADAAQAE